MAKTKSIEYQDYFWGELIHGTKEDLQSLGIAAEHAFPGEPGGAPNVLHAVDPRGLKVKISRVSDEVFSASIDLFPHDPCPEIPWEDFAQGVKYRPAIRTDDYRGSGDALAAAGLCKLDQLPGCPGVPKVRVRISSDGVVLHGHTPSDQVERLILRVSKSLFDVRRKISEEEHERRWREDRRVNDEWQARLWAMPRPARLDSPRHRNAQARSHLRLVWSKPDFDVRCSL